MNKYLLVGEKNRLKINRYTDNGLIVTGKQIGRAHV